MAQPMVLVIVCLEVTAMGLEGSICCRYLPAWARDMPGDIWQRQAIPVVGEKPMLPTVIPKEAVLRCWIDPLPGVLMRTRTARLKRVDDGAREDRGRGKWGPR